MNDWANWLEDVICIVRSIPSGKVTTYGLIAQAIGKPRSSRMVGWVLNQCHSDSSVPCHRVVNRMGILSGKDHFVTPDYMEMMLISEGFLIENNQILNFKENIWNPNIE